MSVHWYSRKTVETVQVSSRDRHTPLKRGVNERESVVDGVKDHIQSNRA